MNNKKQHGGKRDGAGRKPSPFVSKRIVIHIRKDTELEYILEATTPRERAEVLIKYLDMLPNSFIYLFKDEITTNETHSD